jgi:hypothetical protein
VPDPDPEPRDGPDFDPRPVVLEALGAMALFSVVADPIEVEEARVIPPSALVVPLDPLLKIFDPVSSVNLCAPRPDALGKAERQERHHPGDAPAEAKGSR